MENINDLKRKRINLQLRIKEWVDKGKNARDLVVEYHSILKQLKDLGVKVENRADYLQLDYWDDFNGNTKPNKSTKPNITPQQESTPVPKLNGVKQSYTLCLAWTTNKNNKQPIQVKKVLDYFKELCLEFVDEAVRETNNFVEHEMRYNFEGTEDAFRLLKICVQFVLDTFAETDFDKFNIAVYGKKKNY